MSKADYSTLCHIQRHLEVGVRKALKKKMVLVGGPRNLGKTTFALGFVGKDTDESHPAHLNWDHPSKITVLPFVRFCQELELP